MLIEDLEVFVAAAESDSFITPVGPHRYETSASKEILRLEKEFGTPLFLREGKNTGVLTEAGEALLLKAKPLIHSYRRTMRTMEQFRPKNDRSVIIGALPILKQYRLNRVFSRFMDDFEDADLRLEVTDGRTLTEGLAEGYYDGIVIRKSMINRPEKLKLYRMATDEMAAILPEDHRYANECSLRLPLLKNEFFYLADPKTQAFGVCWNLLKNQHISTENVRTADIETILKEVAARKGVAILPISTLNVMKQEGVITVPLNPRARLEVVFAVRKDTEKNELMEELIEMIDIRSKAVPSV